MIKVFNDYVIDADDNNYIVKIDRHKQYTDKNGKTSNVYSVIAYCSTLGGALLKIKEDSIRKEIRENVLSLSEAISRIEAITNEFEQRLNVVERGKQV